MGQQIYTTPGITTFTALVTGPHTITSIGGGETPVASIMGAGDGGDAGAYVLAVVNLVSGTIYDIDIGLVGVSGLAGGDTTLLDTTTPLVRAIGGRSANSNIGDTINAGGANGVAGAGGGGGGGGAGGPTSAGSAGANGGATLGGAGGVNGGAPAGDGGDGGDLGNSGGDADNYGGGGSGNGSGGMNAGNAKGGYMQIDWTDEVSMMLLLLEC